MILVQVVADLVGFGIGGILLYSLEISSNWNWGMDYDYEEDAAPVDVSIYGNFRC